MRDMHNLMQSASNRITRRITARWGESIGIYPVIEYPKCGGTWLSRMLAVSLQLPFAQYSRLPVAMPCVLHGHWVPHPSLRNTTYLTRDGRDVMVSFYFHFSRPTENPNHKDKEVYMHKLRNILGSQSADLMDIQTNLPRFIEYIFAKPIACRQNWRDHNAAWLEHPGVSYIKYEDLNKECESALTELVGSLGCSIKEHRIKTAVDLFSMQRMTGRTPGEEDKESFIRKGIVGDWRNHFTKESADIFDTLAGDMLVELGYESDRSWVNQID